MGKQFSENLDKEINMYLKALWYFARVCDWGSFKTNAAKLFEYLETVEILQIKRKFYRIVTIILVALVVAFAFSSALAIIGVSFFTEYRNQLALIFLVACLYELMLLLEFRMHLYAMMSKQKRRKDRFIKGIEDDAKANLRGDACVTVP